MVDRADKARGELAFPSRDIRDIVVHVELKKDLGGRMVKLERAEGGVL